MRKASFLVMGAAALACTSCGGNGLYPVSGKVTYQGAPAAGAFVFFRPKQAGPLHEQTVMGLVEEDGSFELVCGGFGKGAPPGEYDVLIEWKQASRRAKGASQLAARHDRLKGRYADSRHPRFQVVVKAQSNELAPFELSD